MRPYIALEAPQLQRDYDSGLAQRLEIPASYPPQVHDRPEPAESIRPVMVFPGSEGVGHYHIGNVIQRGI